MCMKNINITAVPFTGFTGDLSSGNFCGMGGNVYVNEENKASIHLFVSVIASENKGVPPLADETKYNTCFFQESYEICIRLTESITGQFLDLGIIYFNPQSYLQEGHYCKNIAILNQACLFRDIELYKNPFNDNTAYVVKMLIRHKDSQDWTVQSLTPLKFEQRIAQ